MIAALDVLEDVIQDVLHLVKQHVALVVGLLVLELVQQLAQADVKVVLGPAAEAVQVDVRMDVLDVQGVVDAVVAVVERVLGALDVEDVLVVGQHVSEDVLHVQGVLDHVVHTAVDVQDVLQHVQVDVKDVLVCVLVAQTHAAAFVQVDV